MTLNFQMLQRHRQQRLQLEKTIDGYKSFIAGMRAGNMELKHENNTLRAAVQINTETIQNLRKREAQLVREKDEESARLKKEKANELLRKDNTILKLRNKIEVLQEELDESGRYKDMFTALQRSARKRLNFLFNPIK